MNRIADAITASQMPLCNGQSTFWDYPEYADSRAELASLIADAIEVLDRHAIAPIPVIGAQSWETRTIEEARGFFKRTISTSFVHTNGYESIGPGWASRFPVSDSHESLVITRDGRMYKGMSSLIGPMRQRLVGDRLGERLDSIFHEGRCGLPNGAFTIHQHRYEHFLDGIELQERTRVASLQTSMAVCPKHLVRHTYYPWGPQQVHPTAAGDLVAWTKQLLTAPLT